jgi:hypothetical protein
LDVILAGHVHELIGGAGHKEPGVPLPYRLFETSGPHGAACLGGHAQQILARVWTTAHDKSSSPETATAEPKTATVTPGGAT